jgi:hypothetical protein
MSKVVLPPVDPAFSAAGGDESTLRLAAPDLSTERFPVCVVWTPIPLITWVLPFVGHMGVCDSAGVCRDFAGPYYVSEGNLAFGVATRSFSLVPFLFPGSHYTTRQSCDGTWEIKQTSPNAPAPAKRLADFDRAVLRCADRFRRTMNYNFFCNNCHNFVASCLAEDDPASGFNVVTLAARAFLTGTFASLSRMVWSLLPSVILYGVIVAIALYGGKSA